MRRGKLSRRHIRPTKLFRNLYFLGGIDTRYRVACNVMIRLKEMGEPTPKLTNILKKIRILQDEGFYETVGCRGGLPIIKPSIKYSVYIIIYDLKDFERRLKDQTRSICEDIEEIISRLEKITYES